MQSRKPSAPQHEPRPLATDDLRAYFAALRQTKDFLRDSALSAGDLAFLYALKQLDGATESEIREALASTRSTASRHLAKLVDLGLANERIYAADVRKNHLKASASGENVLFEAEKALDRDCLQTLHLQGPKLRRDARAFGTAARVSVSPTAFAALAFVRTSEKPPTAQEAATFLSQPQPSASMMLAGLQRNGLLEIRPVPQNRRKRALYLTDNANTLFSKVF